MSSPTAQLDYARPKPILTRRRTRWIIFIVILIAIGLTAFLQRRRIDYYNRQALLLSFQRRCLTFAPPPEQVVFDDDPARIAQLIAQPHFQEIKLSDGRKAALWDHYLFDHLWSHAAPMSPGTTGLLFLHERFTPGGERFILTCIVMPNPTGNGLTFELREFRPATWSTRITMRNGLTTSIPEIDRALAGGKRIRLYAGQVDPKDRTHFTIRCEIDVVARVIDGWEGDRSADANGIPVPGLRLNIREAASTQPD